MKISLPIVAFAAVATAQSIGESVPACAGPCLSDAITSATSCSVTDATCQCQVEAYRAIYTAALTCVLNSCGADTAIAEVLPAAEAFCLNAVGAISAPPVDETPATSAPPPATTSPAAPPPATTTPPPAAAPPASSPEGSFATTATPPASASESAGAAEFSGAAAPTLVGSWLAIGAALLAVGA